MIPVVIDSSEIVGDFQAEEMTLHLTPQLFRMISTSIYECRERAIVQELVANSLDACIATGSDRPIEITLPTSASPHLTVLDHGIGMDSDTLMNSALAYGNSTKTLDNLAVGGFGIGLKSVFSISDSVTITTVKDGLKHVAIGMMLNGRPVHKLISSNPTDETSGTSVTLAVPEEYFGPIATIARSSFTHWQHPVHVDGRLVNTAPLDISAEKPVHVSNHNSGWSDSVKVCIGGFLLDVSLQRVDIDLSCITQWTRSRGHVSVIVYADIGELEIAPNRERIEYTSANRDKIQERINAYADEWAAELNIKRKHVLSFMHTHRSLLDSSWTLDEVPALFVAAARLRSICDKGTLGMIQASARYLNRYSGTRPLHKLSVIHGFSRYTLGESSAIETITAAHVEGIVGYTDCARFTLRGNRYASGTVNIKTRAIRAITKALYFTSVTADVFVVTDMPRAQISRILNHADTQTLDLQIQQGSAALPSSIATQVQISSIYAITAEDKELLASIEQDFAPYVDIKFQFAQDTGLKAMWKEVTTSKRKAPKAISSATAPSARPDVLAHSLSLKPYIDDEKGAYSVGTAHCASTPFYETIEKFESTCKVTGKPRLLIVGTSDTLPVDQSFDSDYRCGDVYNALNCTYLSKHFAEVVVLIAPSKSQPNSLRTTRLLDKLPQDCCIVPEYPSEVARYLYNMIPPEYMELSASLALIRSVIPFVELTHLMRLFPTKEQRRLFASLTPVEQTSLLAGSTGIDYARHGGSELSHAIRTVRSKVQGTSFMRGRTQRTSYEILSTLSQLPSLDFLVQFGLIPNRMFRVVRKTLAALIQEELVSLSKYKDVS